MTNQIHKYNIGDILAVQRRDYIAYLLIEDMDQHQYHFIDFNLNRRDKDSIWYVDNHKAISRAA